MADDVDKLVRLQRMADVAPPPKTQRPPVDYHSFLPDVADRGKPLSTIDNLAEICRRLSVVIRYNVIAKVVEILASGVSFSIDNRDNASLEWLISECAKFRMPTGNVAGFTYVLADMHQYNPVASWIESKAWDGQDRLSDLIATVGAKGERENHLIGAMKRTLMTRWMVSAVAAAYRPNGVSAHGVLVFQGPQYSGKTKWFKSLAPDSLGVVKDGLILRPDDRDSVAKCISYWLVELGELDATFRRSDIAHLKSFLTSDGDVFRRPYARTESRYPRRTVFFASVNPHNFLHDETGNRRYWTIEVEALEYDHQIDMQQCWAQVKKLYDDGTSWYLPNEEFCALNEHNAEFESADPIDDLLSSRLDWASLPGLWNWRTVTDVLISCGMRQPSKSEVTKAGIVIRKRNGQQSKRDETARYVLVPPVVRE